VRASRGPRADGSTGTLRRPPDAAQLTAFAAYPAGLAGNFGSGSFSVHWDGQNLPRNWRAGQLGGEERTGWGTWRAVLTRSEAMNPPSGMRRARGKTLRPRARLKDVKNSLLQSLVGDV
jgi:hypothetical protein